MAVDKNKRILVVDDSKDNVLLIELLLRSEGYQVNSASNGLEGLANIYKHPPDLILLDLMMPDISGLEVIQRLKQRRYLPTIPLILLTANSYLQPAEVKDADAVCHKPFNLEHILKTIESAIASRNNFIPRQSSIST